MNVAYRDEGDLQPTGSDRGQVGVVDVTDKRVVSSKTTTAFVQARAQAVIDTDHLQPSQTSQSTAQEVPQ